MSVLAEIYKRLFALKNHKHSSISDIEDFEHEHKKSDITDFTHQHKKQDITDFTHQHLKADITDFGHTHDASEVMVAVSDEVHESAPVQAHIEEIYRQTEELYQKKVSSVNGSTPNAQGNVVISNISGNAATATTATKLANKRQIALSGDVSGSAMFDGSSAIDIVTTVANNSHTHTKSQITDFPEIQTGIPRGFIGWFNLTAAPSGWAICDGTNGTPNLIGRYPLGATSGIGSAVAAGLPNITGETITEGISYMGKPTHDSANKGAFYVGSTQENDIPTGSEHNGGRTTLYFDASRSNSTYGNSTTVTPPSIKLLPCMKL